jgi:hypothetical protein
MGWREGQPHQAGSGVIGGLWNLRGARVPLVRNSGEAQSLARTASRGRVGQPPQLSRFDNLIVRAKTQYTKVEEQRLIFAKTALHPPTGIAPTR